MSQSSLKSTPPASSPSTTVTTPEQSPGADDDIWDTSSDYHDQGFDNSSHHQDASDGGEADRDRGDYGSAENGNGNPNATGIRPRRGEILSDVPSLRRQHMTDGYREGLSVGKARVMQAGFDAGYPYGVEIGLRVGRLLGVLEGIVSAATSAATTPTTTASMSSNVGVDTGRSLSERRKGGNTISSKTSHVSDFAGSIGVSGPASASNGASSTIDNKTDNASVEVRGKSARESRNANTADANEGVVDVQFVRRLYERAKDELKISELLKVLDDAKIAQLGLEDSSQHQEVSTQLDVYSNRESAGITSGRIEGNEQQEKGKSLDLGDEGRGGDKPNSPAPSLPQEIETVLAKWEEIVLGSLS
ncbi:hypothetical protein A1O1_05925 [Capronia coronata CBS 617.96]|uniref:Protein YAE1 n=1 Tax=Capronia coronata CBS 617.96 TaxID=1182541 RepID=W9Y8J5_9EURO|nr:uncharacterized protein A1O1_05925 [Capronia coronata CBS 617.96]EXJ85561.1 hypothetical protein A1O1_05925 [Capronia coronata CBS 617.96]